MIALTPVETVAAILAGVSLLGAVLMFWAMSGSLDDQEPAG